MKRKVSKTKSLSLSERKAALDKCVNAPTALYAKVEQLKKKVSRAKVSKKAVEMSRHLRMREALEDISEHASQAAEGGGVFVSGSGVLHADFRLTLGSDEEAQNCASALRRVTKRLRKKSLVALKSKLAAFNKKY